MIRYFVFLLLIIQAPIEPKMTLSIVEYEYLNQVLLLQLKSVEQLSSNEVTLNKARAILHAAVVDINSGPVNFKK